MSKNVGNKGKRVGKPVMVPLNMNRKAAEKTPELEDQFIYVVITHPAGSDWHQSVDKKELLQRLCERYSAYVNVMERGKSGTHYHYNIIVWTSTTQRDTYEVRKTFLEYYDNLPPHRNSITCQMGTDIMGLMRYIHKEGDMCEVINEKGGVYAKIGKNPRELYEDYKKLFEETKIEPLPGTRISKRVYMSKAAMIEQIEQFIDRHKIQCNSYEQFITVINDMNDKEGYIMLEAFNRPRHYYACLRTEDARKHRTDIMRVNGAYLVSQECSN